MYSTTFSLPPPPPSLPSPHRPRLWPVASSDSTSSRKWPIANNHNCEYNDLQGHMENVCTSTDIQVAFAHSQHARC